MSMKVGLITYHTAYNFGSMLQAYATQEVIRELGYDCAVMNYRMLEQKDFYALFRTQYGFATTGKDMIMLPFYRQRRHAVERYEAFLRERMQLTQEFNDPADAAEIWKGFDVAISGSDQIWNKHSFEMEHNDWSSMDPYLLKGFPGRKISYASSVGGMTDEELERIAPALKAFDAISVRESVTRERLQPFVECSIENVLDPTFLLNAQQWIEKMGLVKRQEEPYILYYTLRGYKKALPRIGALKQIARKSGCRMKVISPFYYLPYFDSRFETLYDLGPIEFLNEIYNARMVIAESYHGTILPLNLNREVFSLCGNVGAEYRKTEILKKLGLEDRIIYNLDEVLKVHAPIDYSIVNEKLEGFRHQSVDYLKNALSY